MIDWLAQGDYGTGPSNWQGLVLGLLIAFASGQVIAWVYMLTHSGLSYSKSFVSSLILLPPIVCLVMMVLYNNLITAFGMMAVFAIVRFRNILRDTLDTAYILTTIVLGMATGTQKYGSAIIGCLAVAAILLYLWYTSFGSRHRYDLILNFHWERPLREMDDLRLILHRHSWKMHLASQRTHEGYEGVDLSYRLLLRDTDRAEDLLGELREVDGVSRVTSMKADDESEI